MRPWRLVLGVALVFVLGVLVGLLSSVYFRQGCSHFPPPMGHKDRGPFMMERLSEDLDLTGDQKVRAEAILHQMKERLDTHFLRTKPEVQQIFDESFSQLEKLLDDNQKKKFQVLWEKLERERKAREPRPQKQRSEDAARRE